ncbi:YceI family protein [Haliscomenobacter sp.]|uniref:YceI family protein n=1 Tax=Haliscomenobacter sp. TaxID=2717303 RepID=UPI0035947023
MNTSHMYLLLTALLSVSGLVQGQSKYYSKSGSVIFDAEGKLDDIEDIKAQNNSAFCVIDSNTGQMEWSVNINKFVFRNSLMQKHFNENYLESEKYPKATFKGKINEISKVDFTKDGTYPVNVAGMLSLHGVVKESNFKGVITIEKGKVRVNSSFEVLLKDYKIDIPTVVFLKVAESAKVTVSTQLEILNTNK